MTVAGTGVLVAARLGLLVVGVATTAIAFRAYRQARTRYLRDATVGFAIVTAGVLLEGVLYQFTDLSLVDVHLVETVAIGLGFVVLLRSFLQ